MRLDRLAFLTAVGLTHVAWAQELSFSASVDKTTVQIGDPVTLTMTLSGQISGVEIPVFEFPEGFSIASRSQSTNFSLRVGAVERSMSLAYVLVPQEAGTFQLGPFEITHNGTTFPTEAIDITVEKPDFPPHLSPQGGRFTL